MKKLVLALAAAGSAASAQAAIIDGGFESQGAASMSNYCYFGQSTPDGGACQAGAWTGSGNTGLQLETNSAWPGAPTPDGAYYAFVQGDNSVLSQTFTIIQGGSYQLSWLDAGRPATGGNNGDQTYSVTVDGLSVFTGSTASLQPFTSRASDRFTLAAGTYTLSYNGLTSADSTAFIDGVSIAAVPEPTTWALLILGLGATGAAMRRRTSAQVRARRSVAFS